MKSRNRLLSAAFLSMGLTLIGAWQVYPISHKFITIDEGLKNLLYINESDSTKNWLVDISGIYPARDMQLIGNNRILIGHPHGYTEFDITTGAVKRTYAGVDSITTARRLPNGQTILWGRDTVGAKGPVMYKLDSNNVILKRTSYPGTGTYFRIVRQTKAGTFLCAIDDTVKEADTNGNFIWKTGIPGSGANKHMWEAVRLDNGNTLVATGYGACLAEISSAGVLIQKIGAAPQPAGTQPHFYAMFQVLSNGDYVVTNWIDHGPGHDTLGKVHELIEYSPTGGIVWTWDKPTLISSLQGVLVLDSLNTNLLYDNRNGVMAPLVNTAVLPERQRVTIKTGAHAPVEAAPEFFTLSGKRMATQTMNCQATKPVRGVYLIRNAGGSIEKRAEVVK